MLRILYYSCIVFVAGCFISCSNTSKEIIQHLKSIKGQGILFGHQDDLAYGIDWKYVKDQSDVKRVSGDYPALFGWELGGIELGNSVNLDSVPFDKMKDFAVEVDQMGGINTFSWHPYSVIDTTNSWTTSKQVVKYILPNGNHHSEFLNQLNRVGQFFQSLTRPDGELIPFIFRPWHEMDGDWFWWGDKHCTKMEFKELFRLTVTYLRNNFNLPQMVIAYSPDCNFLYEEDYLQWYPGDEFVDILGMDNYYDLRTDAEDMAVAKLKVVINLANKKNKLSALTETGLENVTDSLWYTHKLGYVLNDSIVRANISYVMVWRNDPDVHYFFPYPGHKAEKDAASLLNSESIWLLSDYKSVID